MGKILLILAAISSLCTVSAQAGRAADSVPAPVRDEARPDAARSSSGLAIPRFVTLGSNEVRVRTGPSLRYPIRLVYKRRHLPVEIIQEFDTWRKIRDIDGDGGWVHSSMVAGARSGIVKGEARLVVRNDPDPAGRVLAYFEPDVIAAIDACKGGWCHVASGGYDGWAERKFLWGIYDSEEFD